jgi:23S rRNA pseudouridine955/2504/2580 synthase
MIKFEDIILFESDDYIAVNKPYGISSLDDRIGETHSVLRLAKKYWPESQMGHRLDKETSGVIAIAKNPEAYRHLSMQFEHREVIKVYHAIVEGIERLEDQMVELPILKMGEAVKIDREGKEAATIFNTLQVYQKHSLIGCFPVTGRMHQIRIHLASIGRPIVADKLYGGKEVYLSDLKRKNFKLKKWTEEQPLMGRVALHAYFLKFKNLKGEAVEIQAPYPKDFSALVRQLERNER